MGHFAQDLRFAVRMLFKKPVFTLAALVTLALGIGMNVAVFSAVHSLLFRPLPVVQDDSELVQLYRSWPGPVLFGSNSVPHFQDLRDRVEAFDGQVAAWRFVSVSYSSEDSAERLMGNLVSANYFDVLGVSPVVGRGFLPEEAVGPGAHAVVVLSHSAWQTRFGGDPSVVGRTVTLNGMPFTVVGVAPEGFKGTLPIVDPPFYVPLMMQREMIPGTDVIEVRGSNSLNVVARRAPGFSVERTRESLDAFLLQMAEEYPDHYSESGVHMVPQREAGIHPTLRDTQVGISAVVMAVVAFLLLIACINVANLFLARAGERRREMGIRLSLGARKGRIMSQLLVESLLLAVVAGALGLGLAYGTVNFLNTLTLPVDFPVTFDIEVSRSALLLTLGLSLLTGILFGLAPALQASRPDTVLSLKGEGGLDRPGRFRLSNLLITVQTALSVVLLIVSGLFIRGLQAATQVDKGFEEENLLVASVDPGLQGYDRERTEVFYRELRTGLEGVPGVESVGFGALIPLSLNSSDRSVQIPGYEPRPDENMSISYNIVGEGYFPAMGIRLLQGRALEEGDGAEAPGAVVVNQRFAERFWPGEDQVVGRTITTNGGNREWTVVGVAETGKYVSLGEDPMPFMYFPQAQLWTYAMTVYVRAAGSPEDLVPAVREEVARLDPRMPVTDLRTMTNQLGIILFPARLAGISLGVFGILGMLLAAVGLYGVMAFTVSQRLRELAIRVALGAPREALVRMVVRKGMMLVAAGFLIGLVLAAVVSLKAAGILYGVRALEPFTFLGVPLILGLVALLATYLPARHAASVDPMNVLRSE